MRKVCCIIRASKSEDPVQAQHPPYSMWTVVCDAIEVVVYLDVNKIRQGAQEGRPPNPTLLRLRSVAGSFYFQEASSEHCIAKKNTVRRRKGVIEALKVA